MAMFSTPSLTFFVLVVVLAEVLPATQTSALSPSASPEQDSPRKCGPMTCHMLTLIAAITGTSLLSAIAVAVVMTTRCCSSDESRESDPLLASGDRVSDDGSALWHDDEGGEYTDDEVIPANGARHCLRTCSHGMHTLEQRCSAAWWRYCCCSARSSRLDELPSANDVYVDDDDLTASVAVDRREAAFRCSNSRTRVAPTIDDEEGGPVLVLPTRRAPGRQPSPSTEHETAVWQSPPSRTDTGETPGTAVQATAPWLARDTMDKPPAQEPVNPLPDSSSDDDVAVVQPTQPSQPVVAQSTSTSVSVSSRSSGVASRSYDEQPAPVPGHRPAPQATLADPAAPPPPPEGFYWPREVKLDANFRPIREEPTQPSQPIQPVVTPPVPTVRGACDDHPPRSPPRTHVDGLSPLGPSSFSRKSTKPRTHMAEPWQPVVVTTPSSRPRHSPEPLQPTQPLSSAAAPTSVVPPAPYDADNAPLTDDLAYNAGMVTATLGPRWEPQASWSDAPSVPPVTDEGELPPHQVQEPAPPTTAYTALSGDGDFLEDDLTVEASLAGLGHGVAEAATTAAAHTHAIAIRNGPYALAPTDLENAWLEDDVRPSSLHIFSGSMTTSASSMDTPRSNTPFSPLLTASGGVIQTVAEASVEGLPSTSASQTPTPLLQHASTPPGAPADSAANDVMPTAPDGGNVSGFAAAALTTTEPMRASPRLGARSSKVHHRQRHNASARLRVGGSADATSAADGPSYVQSVDPRFYGIKTHQTLFGAAAHASSASPSARVESSVRDGGQGSSGAGDVCLSTSVGGFGRTRALTSHALAQHARHHHPGGATGADDTHSLHAVGAGDGGGGTWQFPWSDGVRGYRRTPSNLSHSSSSLVSGGSAATAAPMPGSQVDSERLSVSTPSGVSEGHHATPRGDVPHTAATSAPTVPSSPDSEAPVEPSMGDPTTGNEVGQAADATVITALDDLDEL